MPYTQHTWRKCNLISWLKRFWWKLIWIPCKFPSFHLPLSRARSKKLKICIWLIFKYRMDGSARRKINVLASLGNMWRLCRQTRRWNEIRGNLKLSKVKQVKFWITTTPGTFSSSGSKTHQAKNKLCYRSEVIKKHKRNYEFFLVSNYVIKHIKHPSTFIERQLSNRTKGNSFLVFHQIAPHLRKLHKRDHSVRSLFFQLLDRTQNIFSSIFVMSQKRSSEKVEEEDWNHWTGLTTTRPEHNSETGHQV